MGPSRRKAPSLVSERFGICPLNINSKNCQTSLKFITIEISLKQQLILRTFFPLGSRVEKSGNNYALFSFIDLSPNDGELEIFK